MIKIDNYNKCSMSNKEYFSMLSICIFTTEFIFLPMILVPLGEAQAIFSLILLTIIKLAIWLLVSKILMKYPGYSIFDIIGEKYNKYIVFVAKAIYTVYLVFVQVLMLITIYSIINSYTLKYISKYSIIILILITLFYTTQSTMNAIFKISKLGLCILIGIIAMMLPLISKIDYTNFFPIVDSSLKQILYKTFILTSFFSGLECSLIYTKFVKDTKSIKKTGILSILCTQGLLIIFSIISYGVLGKSMISKEKWTLFSLIELVQIKTLSSTEIIICFVSIFVILIVISMYTCTTTYCINTMFKKTNNNKRTLINLCTVVILFISTMYISNKYSIYELLLYKQIYPIIVIILLSMSLIKNKTTKDRGGN